MIEAAAITEEHVQKIPEEHRKRPGDRILRICGEAIGEEESDELRSLWARLLAADMDDRTDAVDPYVLECVKRLTSSEARVLDWILAAEHAMRVRGINFSDNRISDIYSRKIESWAEVITVFQRKSIIEELEKTVRHINFKDIESKIKSLEIKGLVSFKKIKKPNIDWFDYDNEIDPDGLKKQLDIILNSLQEYQNGRTNYDIFTLTETGYILLDFLYKTSVEKPDWRYINEKFI
ncbi:MAG: Abi-alpha family protein [Rhodospirillaceae bacterium]